MAFFQFARAQKTFVFKTGLYANGVHHYGREALYADSLAFRFAANSLLPWGFNWKDWKRLDALKVLSIAKGKCIS